MIIFDNGVFREMTQAECDISFDKNAAGHLNDMLTIDDIAEIMADIIYDICLIKLGVDEDDLQTL